MVHRHREEWLDVSPDRWRWKHRDETAPVWPGSHQRLGATWTEEATNFAVWSPEATAVWVCLFAEDGTETRHQLTEHTLGVWHGQIPRRAGRAALRVPGQRPVGPTARAPLQPRQAAARSCCPGDHRRGPARTRAPPPRRPGRPARRPERARLRRVDAPERGRARRLRLGGRHPAAHLVAGHRRLRAARQGLHPAPQRDPRAPARHLCGARQPHRDPLSAGPRSDRDRAAAGAPLRDRAARRRARDAQLLGLQLRRLLRAARRLQLGGDRGQQVTEFKQMVKDLHRAGIEVILDVVYNHTAEGGGGRAVVQLPRARRRRLLQARPRGRRCLLGRDRLRQHRRLGQPRRAAPDPGLAALLGHRDARRRVPLRPRVGPGPHRP